jgi:hypothetical protein
VLMKTSGNVNVSNRHTHHTSSISRQ